ncbi:hypothetical protein HYV82_02940 [Candidatus Woesearchaeota archaeon]|nr:hypothetical protein [Candidatus Woesearchaeota archaeon]
MQKKEVSNMLSDCNYSKVRLLHDLSRVAWYVEKHAKKDAHTAGHVLCHKMCEEIQADLEKHVEKLRLAIEGLSREGKFR